MNTTLRSLPLSRLTHARPIVARNIGFNARNSYSTSSILTTLRQSSVGASSRAQFSRATQGPSWRNGVFVSVAAAGLGLSLLPAKEPIACERSYNFTSTARSCLCFSLASHPCSQQPQCLTTASLLVRTQPEDQSLPHRLRKLSSSSNRILGSRHLTYDL